MSPSEPDVTQTVSGWAAERFVAVAVQWEELDETATRTAATTHHLAFNPKQERDDKGQWAPSGDAAVELLDNWGSAGWTTVKPAVDAVRPQTLATLAPWSDGQIGDPRFADLSLHQFPAEPTLATQQSDSALEQIWDARGFNGPPTVVSTEEFEKAAADGTVVYRGATGEYGAQRSEEFMTGGHIPAEFGAHGSGIHVGNEPWQAERYNEAGGTDTGLRMVVPYDAYVATPEKIAEERAAWQEGWDTRKQNAADEDQPALDERMELEQRALADDGRFAAALGYQALQLKTREGDMFVIQDRTAVIVEDPASREQK